MPDRATDTITTLQHVLASAARIAQDLASDSLLPRLLDLFNRTPREDRETLVNVLEREVDLRNLTRESPSGPLSGVQVTRPNPNARLYFRVADNETVPFVSPEEIVQAVIRAARVVHRASQRGVDLEQIWNRAMVEGLRLISVDERAVLRWYHTRVITILDEAERDGD